ncbi:MAG TPA: hypothetical protein VNJ70_03090 [Thermoanaerobaculia bacterium]|nr:hypothetical protein [Thermoanaerobaculia bacterium]
MRISTLHFAALLAVVLLAAGPPGLHAQPPEETPLKVSFEEQAVVVSGLAPGARVAWLSLASEPHRYFVRDVRREGIEAGDGKGTARIDAGEPVPPRSVWGVVDLESGAVAWAAPEGFPLEEIVPEGDGLARDDGGRLNRLVTRVVGLELLVARPGSGAWGLTVFDGSPDDQNGQPDGEVVAALEEGRPLLDSPAPTDQLLPGDVVLGIDPRTYRVFTLRSAAP